VSVISLFAILYVSIQIILLIMRTIEGGEIYLLWMYGITIAHACVNIMVVFPPIWVLLNTPLIDK